LVYISLLLRNIDDIVSVPSSEAATAVPSLPAPAFSVSELAFRMIKPKPRDEVEQELRKDEYEKTWKDGTEKLHVDLPISIPSTRSATDNDSTHCLGKEQVNTELSPSILSLPIDIRFKIYDALIWLPFIIFITANPNPSQQQRKQTPFTSLLLASKAQNEEIKIWFRKTARKHELESMNPYYMSGYLPGIWNPKTTTLIVERGPYEETDIFLAPQKENGMQLNNFVTGGIRKSRSSGHQYLEVSDDMLEQICYEVENGIIRHFCWVFQLKNLVKPSSKERVS
jgi:hypothetical protein